MRLFGLDLVVWIDPGVPEEVHGGPRNSRSDAEGRKCLGHVVRAIHVARKPPFLVAARCAGHSERVVATAAVLDHLQKGSKRCIVELVEEAWTGISAPHHAACRGAVDREFLVAIKATHSNRLEVRALLPFQVDDLNEFALLDLVGRR